MFDDSEHFWTIYRGDYDRRTQNWSVQIETGGCWPEPLPLRLDLHPHSPTGFSWGYIGAGPVQLSLAVLAHALEDDERALRLYQPFARSIFQHIPQNEHWCISANVVRVLAGNLDRSMNQPA